MNSCLNMFIYLSMHMCTRTHVNKKISPSPDTLFVVKVKYRYNYIYINVQIFVCIYVCMYNIQNKRPYLIRKSLRLYTLLVFKFGVNFQIGNKIFKRSCF